MVKTKTFSPRMKLIYIVLQEFNDEIKETE